MKLRILSPIVLMIFLNCASVLRGYKYPIELHNVPADLKISDNNGLAVPIIKEISIKYNSTLKNSTLKEKITIHLRNSQDHILNYKSQNQEFKNASYKKLNFGWLTLDFILGIFPCFVDAYTGCWNYFDDINYLDLENNYHKNNPTMNEALKDKESFSIDELNTKFQGLKAKIKYVSTKKIIVEVGKDFNIRKGLKRKIFKFNPAFSQLIYFADGTIARVDAGESWLETDTNVSIDVGDIVIF
jgi:hypothetical protein